MRLWLTPGKSFLEDGVATNTLLTTSSQRLPEKSDAPGLFVRTLQERGHDSST